MGFIGAGSDWSVWLHGTQKATRLLARTGNSPLAPHYLTVDSPVRGGVHAHPKHEFRVGKLNYVEAQKGAYLL